MTTALLDRLTQHCHIVETGNESYRFLHSTAVANGRIKARGRLPPREQHCLLEVNETGQHLHWFQPCPTRLACVA